MCLRLFALLLGCSLLVGCSKTHLYGELPEREANEMMAILMANGISCEKTAGEEGTWSLAVSTSDFADSVEILSGLGRPRSKYESIPEIFPKSSFVSSPTEEHIRYTYSQSQALSKAVSDIPGIISAEVFVVLPQKQTYGESPQHVQRLDMRSRRKPRNMTRMSSLCPGNREGAKVN